MILSKQCVSLRCTFALLIISSKRTFPKGEMQFSAGILYVFCNLRYDLCSVSNQMGTNMQFYIYIDDKIRNREFGQIIVFAQRNKEHFLSHLHYVYQVIIKEMPSRNKDYVYYPCVMNAFDLSRIFTHCVFVLFVNVFRSDCFLWFFYKYYSF